MPEKNPFVESVQQFEEDFKKNEPLVFIGAYITEGCDSEIINFVGDPNLNLAEFRYLTIALAESIKSQAMKQLENARKPNASDMEDFLKK